MEFDELPWKKYRSMKKGMVHLMVAKDGGDTLPSFGDGAAVLDEFAGGGRMEAAERQRASA